MASNATAASCPKPMKPTSNGIFQGDNPLDYALPLAIIQIILVIVLTRILALLLKPLRQPRVIAEIIVCFISLLSSFISVLRIFSIFFLIFAVLFSLFIDVIVCLTTYSYNGPPLCSPFSLKHMVSIDCPRCSTFCTMHFLNFERIQFN